MSSRSRLLATAIAAAASLTVGLLPAAATAAAPAADKVAVLDAVLDAAEAFAPQLVTVHTPTRADKDRLLALGVDATEHAGHDYIEVVLHTPADEAALRDAGFTWDVRIADLLAREAERQRLDAAYAAATAVSPLPSGRDGYRVLADFAAEIDALVAANPDLAAPVTIGQSVEGRDIVGIEIAADVDAVDDGRPVFLMFGAHHAREWPSAELPMEFAHDLIDTYSDPAAPDHDRVVDLLTRGRAVIVPVSNPDGYDASRTSGDLVDLRGTPVVPYNPGILIGTPGNAYKRKNCRYVDGQTQPAGTCVAVPSPGGFGTGVDLNRNYGALWGGPGADDVVASATYHGPAPFSEPETQAIRTFISTRQVTTVITNHTFSNLILRPVGVQPSATAPDGFPVGFAPDECFTDADGHDRGMQALGERMAAQNGYSNQFGWELYDTTGTTEDYSYNATGGYGYTFEIGANEFHPPYEEVVAEYLGTTPAAQGMTAETAAGRTTAAAADCGGHDVTHEEVGGGNREAFLIAFENAVDERTHAVLTGTAPAGATLTLERSGVFPLWDGTPFGDTVATSTVVGADGTVEWHVNPSTRPFVASRMAPILSDAVHTLTKTGVAAPSAHLVPDDTAFEVTRDVDLLTATVQGVVSASGVAADLNEHHIRLLDEAGREVASAVAFGASNSLAWTGPDGEGVPAGTYTLRVDNYLNPGAYSLSAATYDITGDRTPGAVESWTLTCLGADGTELGRRDVVVDRGESLDLGAICS